MLRPYWARFSFSLIFRFPAKHNFTDPIFSNWASSIKSLSIINFFRNPKNFEAIYFFFETRKMRLFKINKAVFFFCLLLRSLTLCHLSVGYVLLIKSNERSLGLIKVLAISFFFQEIVSKFVHAHYDFSRFDFSVSVHFFC